MDAPPKADAAPPPPDPQLGIWEAQRRRGANWFFWIAGLSVVNSVISRTGGNTSFVVGLGVTQVLDVLASSPKVGAAGQGIALGLTVLTLGLFLAAGFLSRKGMGWAFLCGLVLYALDALLLCLLLPASLMMVGFHALALFYLFRGFQAHRALQAAA